MESSRLILKPNAHVSFPGRKLDWNLMSLTLRESLLKDSENAERHLPQKAEVLFDKYEQSKNERCPVRSRNLHTVEK